MQPVLVTGATGFTGSRLVRSLCADGVPVRVIARSDKRAREILPAGVDVIVGDVTDREVVMRATESCVVVYHLAAAFREPGLPDERYRQVHVGATRSLLEAARSQGVRRFVHCSTVGVHSHIEHPPANETCPHRPDDIYQRTKSEGEGVALAFHRESGFPVTVVRPSTIYGPGDLRLLKLFRAIARRRFVMLGPGEVYLHMVYVDDLVRGFRLAAECDAAVGEAFIIAGDEYVTLNDLAARIAASFGVAPPRLHLPVWPFFAAGALCEMICVPFGVDPPIYRRRVAFFTKSRAFSTDKARRVLGYTPRVALDAGLSQTATWYRSQGLV